MIRIELINRENRIEKRETLELVSNAIFGSQSESSAKNLFQIQVECQIQKFQILQHF
jgi:hypothetical protein